jgi:hypothetical protein
MSNRQGYLYRIARADEQLLLKLIKDHVGDEGWAFGGASRWDFVAGRGRDNLRPIEVFAGAGAIDVSGDFGHAFSAGAEVRWKRRDDGMYDVLVLSEDPRAVDGAAPIRARHWNIEIQAWEEGDWTVRRPDVAAIRQTTGRPPISYIDYLAPNGAVQFQRLVRVEP